MRLFAFRYVLLWSIRRRASFLPKYSSTTEEREYSKDDLDAIFTFSKLDTSLCLIQVHHSFLAVISLSVHKIICKVRQIRTNWMKAPCFASFFASIFLIVAEQGFFFIVEYLFKAFCFRSQRSFWGTHWQAQGRHVHEQDEEGELKHEKSRNCSWISVAEMNLQSAWIFQ